MKKLMLFSLSLILVVGLIGCTQTGQEQETSLSELQTIACNTADEAGTCTTRLPEVGIVLQSECCEVLSKCC